MRSLFLSALLVCVAQVASAQSRTNSFEKEILAFEQIDRTNPPPKDAVLFIGSSSIRLWKTLARDLPDYAVINRGFGGSQIADSVYFAERIAIPYRPRAIVMYAGGNDINAGKKPDVLLKDFAQFVEVVRAKLPGVKIAYISVAPNPARWGQIDRVREINRLIREFTERDSTLSFIDVFPHMLGADGQPKPEIFTNDRLHMNEAGYALWTGIVEDHLKKILPPAR